MIYHDKTKYRNRKVIYGDTVFDSRKEQRRYTELSLMERAGAIKDLRRQVKYLLIPSQKRGKKVIERECSYYADFVYTDTRTGETVVEDCKGFRTEVYRIKKKLMLERYGIEVTET